MRFLVKAKTIAISTILLAAMIFPTLATAQRSDLFFKVENEDIYDNRDEITFNNIGNDPFGVPVGSGLLVLTIAGTGYVIARRRRSLRKGATLLLACALILGTTQCKKRIETVTSNPDNKIQITLRTGYGNSRHYINLDQQLGYSPVHFSSGDVIYVGDGTSCIGQLTYGSGGFTGSITTPSSSATHLYFYFVGNLTPTWNSNNSAFTIDIHDQWNNNVPNNNTHKLPVLSCGSDGYYPGKVDFDCTLSNQCVLVRFYIESAEGDGRTDTYRISNMLSEARVDFTNDSEPKITPTGVLDAITLYCGKHYENGALHSAYQYRWAILLKTPEARHTYAIKGENEDLRTYYDMEDLGPFTPGLPEDNYIYDRYTIHNTANNVTNDGVFVVSDNGNVVQFAPGNLQYKAAPAPGTWRFAEHTWDYVGNATKGTVYVGDVKCDNALIASDYSGWIDLFGWGAWGEDMCPYISTNDFADYEWSKDFNGTIYGNNNTGWRTLTRNEWTKLNSYLNGNNKIGKAKVHDVNGAILLPDNCNGTYTNSKWTAMSDETWDTYANMGAIFLPASGVRVVKNISNVNSDGRYWTSPKYDEHYQETPCYAKVDNNGRTDLTVATQYNWYSYYGCPVRLVR